MKKFSVLLILSFITINQSCKKQVVPTVTTAAITNITATTATGGGTVTDEGSEIVIESGVCWSTSPDPTILNNKTAESGGTGTFISNIIQLMPNTSYYVKAYATNSAGTGYGNQVKFTTKSISNPTLTTSEVVSITSTSAISGGNIISDGGATITERGVCWGTVPYPTINNNRTIDGGGTGSFTSNISGLTANTIYYLRAYASNSSWTSYGNEVTFTPTQSYQLTDIDGNVYSAVTIGTQIWMKENLKTTRFNDGASIPNVTDNITWANLTSAAFCWYDNEESIYKTTYGALYNWNAVDEASNGGKNLCPVGWHVPSQEEWTILTDYLTNNNYGYQSIETDIAKSLASTSGWTTYEKIGTIGFDQGINNSSGFTGFPGGGRCGKSYSSDNYGEFYGSGTYAFWWSIMEAEYGGVFLLAFNKSDVLNGPFQYDNYGFSVRCLKDN